MTVKSYRIQPGGEVHAVHDDDGRMVSRKCNRWAWEVKEETFDHDKPVTCKTCLRMTGKL